jgi:glucose/arabinose dehydrogenase
MFAKPRAKDDLREIVHKITINDNAEPSLCQSTAYFIIFNFNLVTMVLVGYTVRRTCLAISQGVSMQRLIIVIAMLLVLSAMRSAQLGPSLVAANTLAQTNDTIVFLPIVLLNGTSPPPEPTPTPDPEPRPWPAIALGTPISGFDQPVHITHASDGSGRLFVVERAGRIRIVEDGTAQSSAFLDIRDRVASAENEQGLFSVAFPPGYASKGYFYVNYTARSSGGGTVIARYQLTADPDVADKNSEQIVLEIDQPFSNHNGGQAAFGPDGHLYIGMGDGGSSGDPQNNGQRPETLLGKLLRIDVETGNPVTYTIPATNPFTQTSTYRPEIWATGLRNPWRFSFDRQTGDLYIGDVGQNKYEEISFQPASSSGGENYGWRIMEGMHCYNAETCDMSGLVMPVAEYGHDPGCSVTGGIVYRGQQYVKLQGIYFYGDFCSGQVWGLYYDGAAWQNQFLADINLRISSFGEDEAGEIYVADYNGAIYPLIEKAP